MVYDNEAPAASCQDISVDLNESGNVSISAGDINDDSTDNCGISGMSLDVTDFDCEDVGENTVTLTVTDVNGNSSECTATVTVNDDTDPDAQCQNFTVNLDVNNSASVSGEDLDDGSSDACGLASLSASPNSFGCGDVGENTVTLTVYDNNGNSSSCTSTVTVVDTEPPVAGCQDVTVTLDENGTGSLSAEQVNNGSSDNCDFDLLLDQTDFTCANQGSNTVTLTVTDGSGNTSTCSAVVTVIPGFSASINPSGSTSLCENECIYLDAGLFASYLWSANAGSSTGQTVEVCDAGTYSVTVTDINGCTSTAEISVTVNPLPTPEITADGATSFCDGGSVELDAGEYSSYQWNALGGNATTQTITTTEAGTYSVTVTDANGCTGVDNIEITIYDLPVVSVDGVTQVCEGGTLNFSASGGNAYTWVGPNDFSSSSDNVTITNAEASMSGTYTVTVSNENGCTSEYEVEVLVNTAPDAQITGNFVVCQDDDLTLVATGGTTYSWSGPNGYSSTGATLVRTNFDATMVGTYSVTVSDNIGCSAETSVTVSISGSGFTVNVTGNTNTCIGGSISLTASAVGAVSYSWLGPDGFVSSGASFTRLNATAGMSGIYTVFVTNANGCVITATREVTVSSTTAIVTGTTNVCVGGSINLIASGGNTYQWSGPGGFSSTGHSILRTNANTTMSGVYSVTVSNALGCTGTANITVTVHPNPSATLTGTSTICSGGTITITAPAGATSYLWSGPNGFTATGGPSMTRTNANTTMTGQYKVTVTNAGGCTATAARSVSVSAPTNAAVTPTTTTTNFCSNANVVFTATTAGVAYNWSGPGGFTATTAAISAPPVAGQYKVTVTLNTGCIATATRNASIIAAPNAVITGNLNVCVGGTISLLASGGNSYNWSGPGGYTRIGNSVLRTGATTAMSGTYTVTVTGSGGCKSTASVVVTVSACKNGEDAIAFETLFAYPNPTNNQTTITFTALKAELMHLSVFAIDGREVAVLFDDMTEAETPYSFELDMSHLPSGTYYAVLRRSDGAAQHLRLMVVR
ncbi:MAG: T9SS type A sorting domain-containing protein [Sphingobacteriales bacterium]|nr:MAG: T9SS type A sorting domain-containing protein [Sphingobacteriales bacterium]